MATILVVDDEPELLAAVTETLVKAGHRVVTAETPGHALYRYEQHRPDLVITDVYMPDIGGVVVVLELAKRAPGRVIAMSGGGARRDLDVLDDARAFGAWRALRKPFRQAELLAVVTEALAQPFPA